MQRFWLLLCGPLLVAAMPIFDTTATMQGTLVPVDAAPGSVIYRLRASDPEFPFPLFFDLEEEITAVTITSLNCTRLNSICQANVVLRRRLQIGLYYDFTVTVTNTRGMTTRMRCSFRATNATTPIGDIFPGAPSLIQVSENARRNTELGAVRARGDPNRGKAVFLELWGSPLFGLRQRLVTDRDSEGVIVLLGALDYETNPVYHLTIIANDAWTEPGKDSRNIATWPVLISIKDEQDTPPVFTIAPPVTILDPKLQKGDFVLQVRAEDGDHGDPRDLRYGLVSEGNPFTPFFNLSEDKGELRLAKPLSEIQAISHAGSPILLTIVAEEVRVGANEPPAQSTSVQIALIPPVPTSGAPHFTNINYTTTLDENSPPGMKLNLTKAEIIVLGGDVITLEIINNNGTFDITPSVVKSTSTFTISVRDPQLLDYEERESVQCFLVAKQLGAQNNSAYASLTVFLNDVNDNSPEFTQPEWTAEVPENSEAGTSVLRVQATDRDTGSGGKIRYTRLIGPEAQLFRVDPISGQITVAESRYPLDCERAPTIQFEVEAADEDGSGLKSTSLVIVNLMDVNDEKPKFEKDLYEFILNPDRKSFTSNAFVKAIDLDLTAPNNEVRYEIVQPLDNLTIDEVTGELKIRPIWSKTDIAQLNVRAWDGGVPRLWSESVVRIYPSDSRTRIVTFIVAGKNPDTNQIERELQDLTGGQVTVKEVKPYTGKDDDTDADRSIVVALVTFGPDTVVDVERIQRIYESRHRTEEIQTTQQAGGLWWFLLALAITALIIAIILIICCICAPCPLYIPPKKRRVASSDVSKLIIRGSGQGQQNKGVQVAEWFGRREAWSPEGLLVDTEAESLRRHEMERGSERSMPRRILKQQLVKDEPREQLYIREGNTDILRLITRGGEQQRPITLVADQAVGPDSGKEILMRKFMDQQNQSSEAVAKTSFLLPNEVSRIHLDNEQLEATLRQQNVLLRQILLEREREIRLETQSLPAGTQTDRDAGTQTELQYLRPPRRRTRSDNDASDASDDDEEPPARKIYKRYPRRRETLPFRRRIKTPIQEESESNVDSIERQNRSSRSLDQIRSSLIRELLKESAAKPRTRSGILKEVLREISDSLGHTEESASDNESYGAGGNHLGYHSDDSIEKANYILEKRLAAQTSHRYHSENDLRVQSSAPKVNKQVVKSQSQVDLRKYKMPVSKRKKGASRYMEWYKNSNNSAAAGKEKAVSAKTVSEIATKKAAAELEAKAEKKRAGSVSAASKLGKSAGPAHPLIQHSEHRYETPAPFRHTRRVEDDVDSGIALARPPMAQKKSVFTIAYADMQTRQLRPESGTPE